MNSKGFCPGILSALLVLVIVGISGSGFGQVTSTQPATDVKGTWSGTLFSNHSNMRSFTMTVVIGPDSKGHLVGKSSLDSDCLKGAHLVVTVTGSNVVLAGSSDAGENITLRGTLDSSGTLLKVTYVLNASASGACETDDGTGNLGKR